MHEVPNVINAEVIWKVIMACCTGITIVLGAAGMIYKVIIKAKEPTTRLTNKVDDHEKRLNEHDLYLKRDKDAIEAINDGNRVTQKALLAIMEFQMSGGTPDALVDAKKDLQAYLINK